MNQLLNLKALKAGLLIALILIALIFFWTNNPFRQSKPKINLSHASVLKEMQSLGRLETASYSIEKIVEAGNDEGAIKDLIFGDKLLLIAHGKVIAGVDLAGLTKEDVSVSGDSILIRLPAPVILNSSLDNSKTTVYDRSQGLLNRGSKDLETEARVAAEKSITQAACGSGILEEARKNAITRIKQLFLFAGFTTVEVTIPEGSC